MDRVLTARSSPAGFDIKLPLAQLAEAYCAMDERRAIEVLLRV
jgi:hypothetical protein